MLIFAHLGLTLASARFLGKVDLAFLALGSLLPDIIDKPLGIILFGTPTMGRTFAHTLLFLSILAALSFYLRDIRLYSLTWGVLAHLVLDQIWLSPVTLLWPLLGPFPVARELDTLSYLEMLLYRLKNPEVSVPEFLGLAYFIYFIFTRRMEILAAIRRYLARPKG
ncbi:LexA-binding, inner membrane-associated putative hydrolase [uncultured archaeon]|nr:LexA-binding, inner membrane-associated putative hydrolase [uncultured archaeon]